eukprot:1161332-Pelagomonas_calceolata.AAC.11
MFLALQSLSKQSLGCGAEAGTSGYFFCRRLNFPSMWAEAGTSGYFFCRRSNFLSMRATANFLLLIACSCSTSQGNISDGVAAYEKAVALNPELKEAWFNMGQVTGVTGGKAIGLLGRCALAECSAHLGSDAAAAGPAQAGYCTGEQGPGAQKG